MKSVRDRQIDRQTNKQASQSIMSLPRSRVHTISELLLMNADITAFDRCSDSMCYRYLSLLWLIDCLHETCSAILLWLRLFVHEGGLLLSRVYAMSNASDYCALWATVCSTTSIVRTSLERVTRVQLNLETARRPRLHINLPSLSATGIKTITRHIRAQRAGLARPHKVLLSRRRLCPAERDPTSLNICYQRDKRLYCKMERKHQLLDLHRISLELISLSCHKSGTELETWT